MKIFTTFSSRVSFWASVGRMALLVAGLCALMGQSASAQVDVTGAVSGNGSYTTLAAAFTAIGTSQAAANIVVSISGNTTETVTTTIGAGTWATVTIQPSGGASRTISGAIAAGSPMIDFSGADNVTINGLNTGGNSLTISNTTNSATSGTSTFRFISDATSNTVTNCTILGSANMAMTTNGGTIIFSTSTTNGNDNNTISNCNIGPAGSNLPSKAIYGNGSTTSTTRANSGITISGNNIYDYYLSGTHAAIYTNDGNTDWTISNNKFYQSASRTFSGTTGSVIFINGSSVANNNNLISGNTIGFANSSGTGTYTLVFGTLSVFIPININAAGTTTATSIQGNTIAGIAMSGTASGTISIAVFRGIYVLAGLTTVGDVSGNTVGSLSSTGSITYTSSSSSASDVIGIFNFGSSAWTTSNNTVGGITAANSSTGAANVYGIRCNTTNSVTWTCSNNTVGGTIANSMQSTSTATGTIVQGILNSNPIGTFTGNTIRNLTAVGGTGTTTSASVIGIAIAASSANQTVSQNTIHTLNNSNASAATVVTGIQFTGSTANTVARNLIYGLTSATNSASAEINGIRVAGGTTTYRNNMIALGAGVANAIGAAASNSGTSGINGFNGFLGTDNFWHNSIYIGGTATAGVGASYAFNGTQTSNTRSFRDNIFVNARSNSGATGKHYAVKINGTTANPTGLTINNNVYHTSGTGGVFGFFNSLDVASLAAWKTAVGQDANSISGDPQYNDPSNATPDLHIHASNATPIEAAGTDLGVTDDYDGQTRSGLTPVDIGADAGNFVGSDVSAPIISYTNLPNSSNTTSVSFTNVTITDAGSGVNTTAGTRPRVYFKKSTNANSLGATNDNTTDGWKYAEANGTTSPFDFTMLYSLISGGVAVNNVIQYFVVAQDLATTPNVGIGTAGTFAATPTSVALTSAAFAIGGTPTSYTINCPTPTGVAAGSVTSSSASISWTCTGCTGTFVLEYGLTGFTPGAGATAGTGGTVINPATSAQSVTGLASNTAYQVYVRQNCGGIGFGANSTVVAFTTPCAAFSVTWTDDLESISGTSIPTCWARQTISGTQWTPATGPVTLVTSVTGRSGTDFIYGSWSTPNAWVFTPGINLTNGTSYSFTFWYRKDGVAGHIINVNAGTGQTAASMTTTVGAQITTATDTWQEFSGTFVPSSSGTFYFGLQNATSASAPDYFLVDDFKLDLTPTIDMGATALVAPATTGCYGAAETVTVTIQNFSGLTIDYSVNPVTVTTNVTGAVTQTLSATLNSGTLAASATQNVNMSSTLNMTTVGTYTFNANTTVTGDGNSANNAMSATTRTVTAAITLPSTRVTFTGFTGSNLTTVFPQWSEGAGASVPSGTTSVWTSQSLWSPTNTTAKINLYTNTRNEWIVGSKFTATASTVLNFRAAITDFAAVTADASGMQGTDDKVMVKISTDCGLSYSTLYTFQASNTTTLSIALIGQSIDLSSYSGQNCIIAFHATDGPIDDAPDYDFHIDNVEILNCSAGSLVHSADGTTKTADRECTDASGNTHYFDDSGTSGDYSDDRVLLSINKNSNSNIGYIGDGTFAVSVAGTAAAANITSPTAPYVTASNFYVMGRYWNVTPNPAPSSNVNVRFYFTDADYEAVELAVDGLNNNSPTLISMRFYKINGAGDPNPANGHAGISAASAYNTTGYWEYTNGGTASISNWALGTAGSDFYSENVVASFSGGGGGASPSGGALPIELISFDGKAMSDYNMLHWSTASEKGSMYQIIERSATGNATWQEIGRVNGHGTSIVQNDYSLKDERPLPFAYYRLRNVDFDGEEQLSEVIAIARPSGTFSIHKAYPNPTNGTMTVLVELPEGTEVTATLLDLTGKVLSVQQVEGTAGMNSLQVDFSGLAAGAYHLQLNNGQTVLMQRVMKQ